MNIPGYASQQGMQIPQVQAAPPPAIALRTHAEEPNKTQEGMKQMGQAIYGAAAQKLAAEKDGGGVDLRDSMKVGQTPITPEQVPPPPLSTTVTPRPTEQVNAPTATQLGTNPVDQPATPPQGTVKGGFTDDAGTPVAGGIPTVSGTPGLVGAVPPPTPNPTVAPVSSEGGRDRNTQDYGTRQDGTPKGDGYLGPIRTRGGEVMTELTVGVNINGREVDIPLLVPTLNQMQVDWLANNPGVPPDQIPPGIIDAAIAHAEPLVAQGLSPFAPTGETASRSRIAPVSPSVATTPESFDLRNARPADVAPPATTDEFTNWAMGAAEPQATDKQTEDRVPVLAREGRIGQANLRQSDIATPEGALRLQMSEPGPNGEIQIILPTQPPQVLFTVNDEAAATTALTNMQKAYQTGGIAQLLSVSEPDANGRYRLVVNQSDTTGRHYGIYNSQEAAEAALRALESAGRNNGIPTLAPLRTGQNPIEMLRQSPSAVMGASDEQRAVDDRILQLQTQLKNTQNPGARAALEASIKLLQDRRANAGQVMRGETEAMNANIDRIQTRLAEVATELQNPNLTAEQRTALTEEMRRLTTEGGRTPDGGVVRRNVLTEPVAPPAGKKDDPFRLHQGAVVDSEGRLVTDPAKLEQALDSSPRLVRDIAVAEINKKLKTETDPVERARLRRAAAEAEIDYLDNRPRDKKRGWKDFFLGLGLGALKGMATGDWRSLVVGAVTGGVGTLVDPDFEQKLMDAMIRRPRAEKALERAMAGEKTATDAREADAEAAAKRATTDKTLFDIERGLAAEDRAEREQATRDLNASLEINDKWIRFKAGQELTDVEVEELFNETGVRVPAFTSITRLELITLDENGTQGTWNPATGKIEVMLDPKTGKPLRNPAKALVPVQGPNGATYFVPPSTAFKENEADKRADKKAASGGGKKKSEADETGLTPTQKANRIRTLNAKKITLEAQIDAANAKIQRLDPNNRGALAISQRDLAEYRAAETARRNAQSALSGIDYELDVLGANQ